ncbi:MAG: hypothetical protein OXE99_10055 [Cellvibrionales bacterium]|nr:hypothetical protein [Cellvibrionales bacterium]
MEDKSKITSEPSEDNLSFFERTTLQQKQDFNQGLSHTRSLIENMLNPSNSDKSRHDLVKKNFSLFLNK